MDTQVAEVNTAIQTPPPGEAAPPSTEASVSVAEHAAQFDPKRPPEAAIEPGGKDDLPPRPKHRAISQRAVASEYDEIAQFTRRLREAEDGIKIEKKPGESDRVYQLRRRAEIAELAKQYRSAPPVPAIVVPPPAPRETAPASQQPPKTASDKPSWKTFEAEIGSKYDTWADAQDAFADARDEWKQLDAKRSAERQQQTQAEAAAIERDRKSVIDHRARMEAFSAKTPDFATVTAEIMQRNMPMALVKAIVTHDNSPEFVYHLAQHPEHLDDLSIVAYGRDPQDDDLVALLQRRLSHYRQPAASIASAATVPAHTPAPRPPNAMRTAPMKTGDDLPGEGHSLAEHQRAFGKRR